MPEEELGMVEERPEQVLGHTAAIVRPCGEAAQRERASLVGRRTPGRGEEEFFNDRTIVGV